MTTPRPKPDLKLDSRLTAIVEAEYPRFSAGEMARRRGAMEKLMADAGVEAPSSPTASRFAAAPCTGSPTGSRPTRPRLCSARARQDTLFVQFYNHLPQARAMMPGTDVRWGGVATMPTVIGELERRGAKAGRVGGRGAAAGRALQGARGEVR